MGGVILFGCFFGPLSVKNIYDLLWERKFVGQLLQ